MRTHERVQSVLIIALAVSSIVAGQVVAGQEPRDDKQGLKETEKFIEEGGDVSQAVGEAKLQLENTLTAYNTLVSNPQSKNMKKDYGRLLKEVKKMDKKAADAQEQIGEMEAAGKSYFDGRATTIAQIQNPQLKEEATQRLDDSRNRHTQVIASLRSAGDSLAPIRKELGDQIKYLGSDLNPSAAATLAPNAQKLNDRSKAEFAKADQAITAANTYFSSMRPSR